VLRLLRLTREEKRMPVVTLTWRTVKDWQFHIESFSGFDAWGRAERAAYELFQSSDTCHITVYGQR
jgi:hypothetical protein